MTDDNSNLVDIDDLDAFENAFYNREPVATEEPKEEVEEKEEVTETEDDALATEETDDQGEPEAKPNKGKKSFQDRINELTAKAREAERREADLLKRLADIEARQPEVKPTPEPTPLREQLPDDAPDPDELLEDGEPKYPLGEFDKTYIRDLTKWTIDNERAEAAKAEAAKQEQQKVEAAQEELRNSWLQKVEESEKEIPDIREKLGEVGAAFEDIDPDYGEFLAATIMSCDFGPEIMYYLSQNIGEAQKIVASGPAAATLAIGRLDAKFTRPAQEEKRNTKNVSNAPTPPESLNRGRSGRFETAGDTDDLDAFEKVFYKK